MWLGILSIIRKKGWYIRKSCSRYLTETPYLCAVKYDNDTQTNMEYVKLGDSDLLEEPYVPHNLSGVMAVNKPVMNEEPVWVAASKNR